MTTAAIDVEDLAAMLYPVTKQQFFEHHWNRRALYIPGTPDKFAGLFDRAAFDRAVHACIDLKVGYTDERGWPAHHNIQPAQIPEMLAGGKTVCASFIDPANPVLTAFLRRISADFSVAGKFFFNSYLSPHGSGFGLHLDHHPVSILQIEGRKRWRYSRLPAVRDVLTNISFPKDRETLKLPWITVRRPTAEEMCEVVLQPGDLLYLPKGTWHEAQADGGSLGLTLAMESSSPLELIQAMLAPRLNTPALRSQLPGTPRAAAAGSAPEELTSRFEAALAELRSVVAAITPAELYALWCRLQER